MNADYLFKQLTQATPTAPVALPDKFGMYALWDHNQNIRYIGCTPKATEGFNTRIANKHVTGSEGRSHKFSHAYCVGRMWRYAKRLHPDYASVEQNAEDAKQAKKLRTLFIRRFCGVTLVEVPNNGSNYFAYLTGLEAEVQSLAPASMRAWEGARFSPDPAEPVALVDRLLHEYPDLRAPAERQNLIYITHVQRSAA